MRQAAWEEDKKAEIRQKGCESLLHNPFDHVGTRTQSLYHRKVTRYHCATRPDLKSDARILVYKGCC